jgi:hypothetical protein
MVAALGLLPDQFFKGEEYGLEGEFSFYPVKAASEWQIVKTGSAPLQLDLQLTSAPGFNSYSMVLSISIEMGRAGNGGIIETIKHTGCGKILLTA